MLIESVIVYEAVCFYSLRSSVFYMKHESRKEKQYPCMYIYIEIRMVRKRECNCRLACKIKEAC
jgi:hypothetical protein